MWIASYWFDLTSDQVNKEINIEALIDLTINQFVNSSSITVTDRFVDPGGFDPGPTFKKKPDPGVKKIFGSGSDSRKKWSVSGSNPGYIWI